MVPLRSPFGSKISLKSLKNPINWPLSSSKHVLAWCWLTLASRMLPSQMLAGLILANQTLASPPLEQSLWLYLSLPHTISNHPSTANHLSPFFLFNPFSFFKMLVCGENSADFNQYHPRVFFIIRKHHLYTEDPHPYPPDPRLTMGG